MYKLGEDIKKVMKQLEDNGYAIVSEQGNTTVIRDADGRALNAYVEISGLNAKSLDEKVELKIEFYLEHERQKRNRIIKQVVVYPDTQEARDRADEALFVTRL